MIRTLAPACALALICTLAPAAADPAPRVLPAHDVTVSYTVSGAAAEAIPILGAPGTPLALRLQWSAAAGRLMASSPGRPQRLMVDLPGHRATVLDDSVRAALFLPMRETDVQALTMAHARFTRRGTERVAGEDCTDWAVQSDRSAGTVCLTVDGVPLRGEGEVNGRRGTFVATAIDRGAVDPAAMALPPGYNRIEMPAFGNR